MRRRPSLPEGVPVLSRGKHRNPRRGACFMEFASWLAGEKFSDHPACTHPLLATVARGVNDNLTDAGRQRIVPLISEVVGLNGDDPVVDVTITVLAATKAFPVAAYDQQKGLAVGLLRCEDEIDAMGDPRTTALMPMIEEALEHCPQATSWAQHFVARPWTGGNDFARARSHIVRVAVMSLALAPAADDRLCDLLETCVARTRMLLDTPRVEAPASWITAPSDVDAIA
jgi:hypothetical protein